MPLDAKDQLAPAYFSQGFPLSRRAYAMLDASSLARLGDLRGEDEARAARAWADRIRARANPARPDPKPATAGELLAMALLSDILRYVADNYAVRYQPGAYGRGRVYAESTIGSDDTAVAQVNFAGHFPAAPLLDHPKETAAYLAGASRALPNVDLVAREALLLAVTNGNPALRPYRLLFDDVEIGALPSYRRYVPALESYFRNQPPSPETGMNLIDTLWAPVLASPDDLEGQLAYVRGKWAAWLPGLLLERILLTGGVLREERTFRGHGPGPIEALRFDAVTGYPEPEAFSVDKDWMPNVVLIAKSTYVWLDQLSKRYGRPIHRLDQIPDEELDLLGRWGFTGLWLIGLWERSSASKTIKQMTGNPEAEASAYSLYDYTIAWDLGGDAAYRNLAERAGRRGIRLASDMVPNHVGIYSNWVVEHPDWFIQSAHPPFPSYTFNGADLSPDGRVSLHIEDGYWDRRDAAVVFKHFDRRNGRTRYIYHGNDGTSMPWNDTAQLNYLLPDVRESVIETIVHVARKFPIIRFDAAMTLAKKHFQRLWFPKLGDAGAIPSRAEHGMSQEEFDRVFPLEFWREVVDRVAAEAPDTLLLAEAFWLMEGYFVRTLGMHRVYNSAFMNMLKTEDNAKYRQTLRNVLEYSPAILQRFVNFMNNPDEDTAEAQFGTSDKYFGVAALLVTMPGLPMFGHGQVEGLTEKYGMEYRRAYRDETVDAALVERHEREIFPLVRKRHLFSGAEHFAFYDFTVPEGWVNEHVYAYSNRTMQERAVIIYNNAFDPASGSIRVSSPINEGTAEEPRLRLRSLVEAIGLDTSDAAYYVYRDYRTGLEYLEHAQRIEQQGLFVSLGGYQYVALLDWRLIHDNDNSWGRLHALLGGEGVPSMDDAYMEMVLAPILEPFRAMVTLEHLAALYAGEPSATFEAAFAEFVTRVAEHCHVQADATALRVEVEAGLAAVRGLSARVAQLAWPALQTRLAGAVATGDANTLTAWALLRPMGGIVLGVQANAADVNAVSAAWMSEWFLTRQLARALAAQSGDAWQAGMDARRVRCMIRSSDGLMALRHSAWGPWLDALATDPDTLLLLRVNHFGGRRWLHRESLVGMLTAALTAALLEADTTPERQEELMLALDDITSMEQAAEDTAYDLDWWLDALK